MTKTHHKLIYWVLLKSPEYIRVCWNVSVIVVNVSCFHHLKLLGTITVIVTVWLTEKPKSSGISFQSQFVFELDTVRFV